MLIDKEMNKNDLKDAAGISAASIAKLGKGANITTDVLLKICEAMDCKLEDIMETIKDWEVSKEVWTVKMYLIFILNRNDILPTEDVAFLQEYEWLYKTTNHSPTSVKNKHKKWTPYSSSAAQYLYRALDWGLTKTEFHLYK